MADTAPAEPHAEFEEKFSDLHDGSLPESERAAVQAHLADCAACAAAYAEFEQTMSALTSIKRKPPAPDAFVDGVAETIHRRSAGRFFGRKTFGVSCSRRAQRIVRVPKRKETIKQSEMHSLHRSLWPIRASYGVSTVSEHRNFSRCSLIPMS